MIPGTGKFDACYFAKRIVGQFEQLDYIIYWKMNGNNWLNNSGWKDGDGTALCSWFGITCNGDNIITEIDLSENNLAGELDEDILLSLPFGLESLKLAKNNISGNFGGNFFYSFGYNFFYSLQNLRFIDMSENDLNGALNMLSFPAAEHLNFSHNKIDQANHFKMFSQAYKGLRVVDLSNNLINQDASEVFHNIPLNIIELLLSNNNIKGSFPDPLPILENMRELTLDSNDMSGTLPDFSRYFPRLRETNLSHQASTRGFVGSIPAGLSNVPDLFVVDVAGNSLTGNIPSGVCSMANLKVLNLASNSLSGEIPKEIGKLGGR